MSAADPIAALARALLYEGYALYPYRASSLKNQQRWFFGGVYPPAWNAQHADDAVLAGAQVLLEGVDPEVRAGLRFLHFESAGPAIEREVELAPVRIGELRDAPRRLDFDFGGTLHGALTLRATPVAGAVRVELCVRNTSPVPALDRDAALPATMACLHAVLRTRDGHWVSQLDPPAALAAAARACVQTGLHPVLAGCAPARDLVLAAPIILEDYPRLAPESAGDLFDGTEIDEILTLRVLTLSDAERAELASAEPRVRELLDRVQALTPREMQALHGAFRDQRAWPPVQQEGAALAAGARVRLRPRAGGDVFDLALAGRSATVIAVEQDLEGGQHLAVVLDDDPGADLGRAGFHGHRFFFRAGEVEPL